MSISSRIARTSVEPGVAADLSATRNGLLTRVALLFFSAIFAFGGYNQIRYAPSHVSRAEEAGLPVSENLVRVNGAGMLLAVLGLQIPALRRASAALLALQLPVTTYVGHRFWEQETGPQRAAQLTQFLKNVSLFGAAVYIAGTSE